MRTSPRNLRFDRRDLEDQPRDQLVIQCAVCGRTFPSGIYVDRSSFEAVDPQSREGLGENVHECPSCGFTTAYGKADYKWEGA